jgi:hypothetical protein
MFGMGGSGGGTVGGRTPRAAGATVSGNAMPRDWGRDLGGGWGGGAGSSSKAMMRDNKVSKPTPRGNVGRSTPRGDVGRSTPRGDVGRSTPRAPAVPVQNYGASLPRFDC